jgi:hypothetical protein
MAKSESKGGQERGAKSNAIREYLKAHPEAKNKEIAEAISKQMGSEISVGLVAQVVNKVKGGGTKRGKKKELDIEGILSLANEAQAAGGIKKVRDALELAQKFATITGSLESAMQATETLEQYKEQLDKLFSVSNSEAA